MAFAQKCEKGELKEMMKFSKSLSLVILLGTTSFVCSNSFAEPQGAACGPLRDVSGTPCVYVLDFEQFYGTAPIPGKKVSDCYTTKGSTKCCYEWLAVVKERYGATKVECDAAIGEGVTGALSCKATVDPNHVCNDPGPGGD